MPASKGPLPPRTPSILPVELAQFVKEAARRLFGDDAVVRSYGESPTKLQIHVEYSGEHPNGDAELIGQLLTKIDHMPVVDWTRRGSKARGGEKIAYRQGYIL